VVIYKVNPITCLIGKMLVNVDFITMVNLIAGEEVFEEYLQNEVTPSRLLPALRRILPDGERRETSVNGMRKAVGQLETTTNASRNAAEAVLDEL
jgi:lipid-A-disaccharide synthase